MITKGGVLNESTENSEFLKRLRKEKGLTQEQLAERFYISSRTVFRWETGNNMPDLAILIKHADFYKVDIREIIDGERKSENMDKETKDTLLKVAEYANEGHKQSQVKILRIALVACLTLILCTILFSSEAPGLLCGIISSDTCYYIMAVVYGLALFLLIFYLRVLPFLEKPSYEPVVAVQATVVSKEIVSGTRSSGRSQMGYSFLVRFRTEDGQFLELYTYEEEYGGLKEGMSGALTYQDPYFVDFK